MQKKIRYHFIATKLANLRVENQTVSSVGLWRAKCQFLGMLHILHKLSGLLLGKYDGEVCLQLKKGQAYRCLSQHHLAVGQVEATGLFSIGEWNEYYGIDATYGILLSS